jgi:hypothetical protein
VDVFVAHAGIVWTHGAVLDEQTKFDVQRDGENSLILALMAYTIVPKLWVSSLEGVSGSFTITAYLSVIVSILQVTKHVIMLQNVGV